MTSSCCAVWDFTLRAFGEDNKIRDLDKIKKGLSAFCKKWAFQLEQGDETGYRHFQGRVSLKIKKRFKQARDLFIDHLGYTDIHLSVTSLENTKNEFYVMKEDTRIDGPWTDRTESVKNVKFTRDVQRMLDGGFHPFQQKIIDLCSDIDDDNINLVICKKGVNGKSSLVKYLAMATKACRVPYMSKHTDLIRTATALVRSYRSKRNIDPPAMLIDFPRATKKDKESIRDIFTAIEEIKGGTTFEDRYHYEECYFERPVIIVFANELLDESVLSRERWKVWRITSDKDMVPYDSTEKSDAEIQLENEIHESATEEARLIYESLNVFSSSEIITFDIMPRKSSVLNTQDNIDVPDDIELGF